MPGKHTDKEKRMARHVKESMKAAGKSDKAAERIGWMITNKRRKKGIGSLAKK